MTPLLVLAEFVCSPDGDVEFRSHLERTLRETRAIDGCLHAVVWERPGRRYQFSTLWQDREAVKRWVANAFHREVLMPGFRHWCTEGWFGEFGLDVDHKRARRCPACQRWSQGQPGWAEAEPSVCRKCGTALQPAAEAGIG
jgi:quinol monooxygenase YgiN